MVGVLLLGWNELDEEEGKKPENDCEICVQDRCVHVVEQYLRRFALQSARFTGGRRGGGKGRVCD